MEFIPMSRTPSKVKRNIPKVKVDPASDVTVKMRISVVIVSVPHSSSKEPVVLQVNVATSPGQNNDALFAGINETVAGEIIAGKDATSLEC